MKHYHRIRDLREDRDLTQEKLCKELYMHKTTYTNYEQGKHTVPLDFVVLIADYYNVSIDYIAERTNCSKGINNINFQEDELELIKKFAQLSEREKGKVEQFIEQVIEQEEEKLCRLKEAK